MANQKQYSLIKQGTLEWNAWRKDHPEIEPDFSDASFIGLDLSRIDLIGTDFSRADLSKSNLSRADLIRSNFSYVNLRKAMLREADLSFADFRYTDLRGTDLSGAYLIGTSLEGADLSDANLSGADLSDADFSYAKLSKANLNSAKVGWTKFTALNLKEVRGLDTIVHKGPSSIGFDTIIQSHGEIPEIFLRNAGIPESIIEQIPALFGSLKPIDYYTCFISYSSKDQAFAERLYADLQSKGVRCWFAPIDLKIGDKFRISIDKSIRIYDKLLLVLSESSVKSDWVKKEVDAAFEKEAVKNRLVLFPIRLDDAVLHTSEAWAADIRRMRHIGDFTRWKDHDEYLKVFTRLLHDLKAES